MAAKFKVTFTCPEEFDGEMGFFVITALRTGRKWRANTPSDTETASEQIDALEPAINDGEKLNPDNWVEVAS